MSYKLSFCIPTLNFGPFIGETLRSITAQADESIQIVIVDGGSTDGTANAVAEAADHFPHIKFIQRESRQGIDLDILESVTHADGEYCWLFSSDDILLPGAIERALKAIDHGGWDVFLMGLTLCDLTMQPFYDHQILSCRELSVFDWSIPAERREYFARAQTSTAFFSFISDIIVNRDRWRSSPTTEEFIGSCWIIAAQLFAMSQGSEGMRVGFDPDSYLLKRGGNDSFASQGLIPRITLSIIGFRRLGSYFFGADSFEAKQISRVISNEYPLVEMLSIKCKVFPTGTRQDWKKFYRLARLHYADQGLPGSMKYLLVRFSPLWIMLSLRPIFRWLVSFPRKSRA